MGRSRTLRALLAALALAGGVRAAAADEKPTIERALWLEKTVRDPSAALQAFQAARAAAKDDAQVRSDAALGEARCLVALGKDAEAADAWKAVLADPAAPTAAKEEAHARLDEREKARVAAAAAAAAARDEEAKRREEAAREDHESRIRAAARLVDSAAEHLRGKRYERARDDLIQALERNPDDARAAALLDEVGGYLADRGDLLRQAIRFVASSRIADYRRLASEVERLREVGRRSLKEGRVADAVDAFRAAIARVDESDFYAELSGAREESAVWLEKALADPRLGTAPAGAAGKPPERPADPPSSVRAWRSEFFALLGRLFASRAEGQAPLRFFDAAIPPNPDRGPGTPEGSFASRGISTSKEPGTLRRARWLERVVRAEIAPGNWTGPDRLLERYDDLVLAQHTPQVLRQVEGLLAAFPATPPPPTVVEVRVLACKPGGAADVVRVLGLSSGPTEPGGAAVARGRRLDEILDAIRADSDRVDVIEQVTARLEGRHALLLHVREPTSACPLYADREAPPIVIADRDATYGLDLDIYAEDLVARGDDEAISVAATVRRPDRARVVPRSSGIVRVPVFLSTTAEADKRVPRAGAIALFGLPNPFRATGAAGDPTGGEWPDLVVLVAARPAGPDASPPDVPASAPADASTPPPATEVTRELDLGPLGDEIADEPPPEDWPTVSSSSPRPEVARASRDAWLSGHLAHAAGLPAGALAVRDGRVVATLPAAQHARVAAEIAALARDEARTFALEAKATEVSTEDADAVFAQARVAPALGTDPARRVWVIDAPTAARLEERLRPLSDPRGLFALDARVAARHTQLVTARAVRSRSIVEDFRIVHRADGSLRTLPVNGTVEEGLVVATRPVADAGGFVALEVGAVLARVVRSETWRPPGVPGEAPPVTLPQHRVEPAWVTGRLMPGDAMLVRLASPGTEGARVVLLRLRRVGS